MARSAPGSTEAERSGDGIRVGPEETWKGAKLTTDTQLWPVGTSDEDGSVAERGGSREGSLRGEYGSRGGRG